MVRLGDLMLVVDTRAAALGVDHRRLASRDRIRPRSLFRPGRIESEMPPIREGVNQQKLTASAQLMRRFVDSG